MSKTPIKIGVIGGIVLAAISMITSFVGLFPLFMVLNCIFLPLACLSFLTIPAIVAFFAAYKTTEETGEIDFGSHLKYGSIAVGVVFIISTFVSIVISVVQYLLGLTALTFSSLDYYERYGDYMDGLSTAVSFVIGIVCGLIVLVVIYAVLALIGSAISYFVQQSKHK